MKKENILKRIEQLSKLCEETEPTFNEMMNMDKLFTQDLISVDNMYLQVEQDEYSPNDLIDIMKECNWIWKKRNKIKEVGWDEYNNIDRKIEEAVRIGIENNLMKTNQIEVKVKLEIKELDLNHEISGEILIEDNS